MDFEMSLVAAEPPPRNWIARFSALLWELFRPMPDDLAARPLTESERDEDDAARGQQLW
jgi:hypothetical protein